MTGKTVGFILLSIAILTFSAEVLADGAVIRVRGQIVNGTCDVRVAGGFNDFEKVRTINVSRDTTLAMNAWGNVCTGPEIIFSTDLRKFYESGQSTFGVVTLTYQ